MKNTRAVAQPVDTTCSCPRCQETAIRDEALLDLLQTAMIALTAVDGYDDWRIRSVRFKAALREALLLMQTKRW